MNKKIQLLRNVLVCCCSLAALAGCAGRQAVPVADYRLDEGSGANIISVSDVMVFFHEQPSRAVHVRDYLYLGPLEINVMSKHRHYLWLGEWSTIDRIDGSQADLQDAVIYLFIDGVPVELSDRADADDLTMTDLPYHGPVSTTGNYFFRVSRDLFHKWSQAGSAEIKVVHGNREKVYRLWNGDAQALAAFLGDNQRLDADSELIGNRGAQ